MRLPMNNSLYGNYRHRSFSDVYPTADEFISINNSFPIDIGMSNTDLSKVWFLLYAQYADDIIASDDENHFKADVCSRLYQYFPTYKKKMELQNNILLLTEAELMSGGSALYNHSNYTGGDIPATAPDELSAIDAQNVTKYKKSKLEAYTMQSQLLQDNLTKDFLNKFKSLFQVILEPEEPLWYATQINEEGE